MRRTISKIEDELKSLPELCARDQDMAIKKAKKIMKGQDEIKFFYTSHVRGKYMYFCTRCQKWHIADKKWKKNKKHKCECGARLMVTGPFEMKNVKCECDITKFENIGNELIARVMHVERIVSKKENYIENFKVYEVERVNFDMRVAVKRYTWRRFDGFGGLMHGDKVMSWCYGEVDRNVNTLTFRSDRNTKYFKEYYYGNVIGSMKRVFDGTQFKYCALDQAKKMFKDIDPMKYLIAYEITPELEQMIKAGADNAVKDTYNYPESMRRVIDSIGIKKVIKHNLSEREAILIAETAEHNPDINLIKLMAACDYRKSYSQAKKDKRAIAYVVEQSKKVNDFELRRIRFGDYEDYVAMIELLGYEKSKAVLYPHDFWAAHNLVADEYENLKEEKKSALINDGIRKNALEHMKISFADRKKGLLIRPAVSNEELINESKEMHHCVRIYGDKVAKNLTEILFVRKINDRNKPFVTVELKGNKVIQARSKYNARPSDETIEFINNWCIRNKIETCFKE